MNKQIIEVDENENLEELMGNINNIKNFDDCKKAGFQIKDGSGVIAKNIRVCMKIIQIEKEVKQLSIGKFRVSMLNY
jgi:pyridoxine 5'-phosphate synthase PdxJ